MGISFCNLEILPSLTKFSRSFFIKRVGTLDWCMLNKKNAS